MFSQKESATAPSWHVEASKNATCCLAKVLSSSKGPKAGWIEMAQDGFNMAPGAPQDGPTGLQQEPLEGPKKLKSKVPLHVLLISGLPHFHASVGTRRPRRPSRSAHKGHKELAGGPGRPQESFKLAQEGLRRDPGRREKAARRLQDGPESPPPLTAKRAPRRPKRAPRRPERLQNGPIQPQGAPKLAPQEPRAALRRPRRAP